MSAYATCITAYQPNRLMSTGFVPSSVSTVCVTRQPWAAAKSRHFCLAGERAQGFGLHASSGIGGLAVLLRQGAVHGSARLQEIGRPRPSRRLPVVLTPDEVVRILGFLEGEHRLFAQLLYGTGMRISEGLQLRVKDLDFDHGTIIVREGKGSKDRALMLPESLAPSLREQLSRARAWWLKDQAEGRSGVALPDALERKYPRAGHSGRGSGFLRSTRIRPIHGAVSCVAITCMTRPFSAPSNVP